MATIGAGTTVPRQSPPESTATIAWRGDRHLAVAWRSRSTAAIERQGDSTGNNHLARLNSTQFQ